MRSQAQVGAAIGVVAGLALLGCGLIFGSSSFPGLASFAAISSSTFENTCKVDAGVRVYDRPIDVAGYSEMPGVDAPSIEEIVGGRPPKSRARGGCFPCFDELVRDGYQYIEAYYIAAADREGQPVLGRQRDYYTSKTGLYRYELLERSEAGERCDTFDRIRHETRGLTKINPAFADPSMYFFAKQFEEYAATIADKCVVASRIENFSALYRIGLEQEVLPWSTPDETVYRRRSFIESKQGTVVAEGVSYAYFSKVPQHYLKVADARCGSIVLPPVAELLRPAGPN